MHRCVSVISQNCPVVFHQKCIFNFWNSWINELAKNDREPVGRRRSGASRKSWTLWFQRVKMTDEGLSKAEEWLTKARAVNFSGNIDKHVGVTILLILFPLLIFLLNSLLYGEVINVGNLKKERSYLHFLFLAMTWKPNSPSRALLMSTQPGVRTTCERRPPPPRLKVALLKFVCLCSW